MLTKTDLCAADIMTSEMITIDASASIREAAALLTDNGISGAPVRDEFGRIVGLISLRDIARFEREKSLLDERSELVSSQSAPSHGSRGKKERVPWGYHVERPEEALVRDFMTPIVISLPKHAPLTAVVRTMLDRNVRRVLVNDAEGEIVGIISAFDMLRAMADGA